ncbi:MAG: tRNA lysidine(34) synthetase TilS [Clostridia bacterium]|nr:tRNA lysidine(34) synthetase TilS [Clostridia bacterium]
MIDKVKKTISSLGLIEPNDKILVALSGGADSVFLIHMLHYLKNEYSLTLGAAHVNHCIRGEDANKDQNFCKSLCAKLDIPYHTVDIDIPKLAKDNKISEETAGRNARYNFFNEISHIYNYDKIAVAHNMNDSVETLIINLIRGCSLNGLCGIKPKNKNIIRPIYNVERYEIENYLSDNNIEFCTDKTNFENIYTRNKIRNCIINQMKEINPSVVKTIFSNIKNFNDDNEYFEKLSDDIINESCSPGNISIDIFRFKTFPKPIKKRVILKCLHYVCNYEGDVESKHIDILLQDLKNGQVFDMPHSVKVYVTNDKIIFSAKHQNTAGFEIPVSVDDIIKTDKETSIILSRVSKADFNDKNSLYIDYDKVCFDKLVLRSKKEGDKIRPYGMKGTKKLKQLFNDLKIPSFERGNIPILCESDKIVAVIPYRISDDFKITDKTKNILRIQMIKENK